MGSCIAKIPEETSANTVKQHKQRKNHKDTEPNKGEMVKYKPSPFDDVKIKSHPNKCPSYVSTLNPMHYRWC